MYFFLNVGRNMVTFDSLIDKVSLSFFLFSIHTRTHARTHVLSLSLSLSPIRCLSYFPYLLCYHRFWVKRLHFFLCYSFDVIEARDARRFLYSDQKEVKEDMCSIYKFSIQKQDKKLKKKGIYVNEYLIHKYN